MDAFLVFTVVCDLLLPGLMLLFGALSVAGSFQKPNAWCGYRTRLSVRTKETWRFAHRYFGRLWLIFGAAELALTAVPLFGALVAQAGEKLEAWSLLCLTLQLVGLVIPIFPTERALRTQFDRYGCPITPLAQRLSRDTTK